MSYAEIEMNVVQWGEARGIVQNGQPIGQARKTLEEAGELVEATGKWKLLKHLEATMPTLAQSDDFAKVKASVLAEAKDAIGDTLVTLIMCAATLDVSVVECLEGAYDEIKDRRGYLRADGVFVKEA